MKAMTTALRDADPTVIKLPIRVLTPEAFAPYGTMLQFGNPIYPEVDGGRPVIYMSKYRRKDGPQRFEEIATHFSYTQTITVLQGMTVLVVAPPPRNRGAPFQEYEFDYDNAAAFQMEPGMTVEIARGTWHSGLALTAESVQMTGTRCDVEKDQFNPLDDVESGKIPVRSGADKQRMQVAIEHINLRERDNRVLEIVL